MSAHIITTITWQGIHLTVRHVPDWGAGFDHIEITSQHRSPFPISETGYRSHFLPSHCIEPYGDASGYVQAWLDEAGRSESWKRTERETRQLSLF